MTRAGIHADGLLKDDEIYNIFNTDKILHRPAMVAVDSYSGLAGIALWMNGYFRLRGDDAMAKQSPLVVAMKERVDAEYANGKSTPMSDEELVAIMRSIDPNEYERISKLHKAH